MKKSQAKYLARKFAGVDSLEKELKYIVELYSCTTNDGKVRYLPRYTFSPTSLQLHPIRVSNVDKNAVGAPAIKEDTFKIFGMSQSHDN